MQVIPNGAIESFTVDDPWVDVKIKYHKDTDGIIINKDEAKFIIDILNKSADEYAINGDLGDGSKFYDIMNMVNELGDMISALDKK